jgi:hypothetical protein
MGWPYSRIWVGSVAGVVAGIAGLTGWIGFAWFVLVVVLLLTPLLRIRSCNAVALYPLATEGVGHSLLVCC